MNIFQADCVKEQATDPRWLSSQRVFPCRHVVYADPVVATMLLNVVLVVCQHVTCSRVRTAPFLSSWDDESVVIISLGNYFSAPSVASESAECDCERHTASIEPLSYLTSEVVQYRISCL